jgi:hypothetical protein
MLITNLFIWILAVMDELVMVVYLDEVTFKPLPDRANPIPYCIIGDDAFPLKNYIRLDI